MEMKGIKWAEGHCQGALAFGVGRLLVCWVPQGTNGMLPCPVPPARPWNSNPTSRTAPVDLLTPAAHSPVPGRKSGCCPGS